MDVSINSSAQKRLGIGAGTAGVPKGYLNVQKEGWLYKRPFTGSVNGAWQKRYFILKDSFLFWFDAKTEAPFASRPKGALPLGAAQAFYQFKIGKLASGFVVTLAVRPHHYLL